MQTVPQALSNTFQDFVNSEKTSGVLLVLCAVVSMSIANAPIGPEYASWWSTHLGPLTLEHWINDALMAIFFLLIGLELEHELYRGELSTPRNALLPIVAAIGGVALPALIHLAFNAGTPTQKGIAIPTATDIAFVLGVLALLGSTIPASLKVFVVALAVIDDLCAVVIIAIFYTTDLSTAYLVAALAVWAVLCLLNRVFRIMHLAPYLLGGALMWILMLKSGVHATMAGVLLAFAIPFKAKPDAGESPSHRLEHLLDKPVAFFILPLFALANTVIVIGGDWLHDLASENSFGIIIGLVLGKPLGITLFCFAAVAAGICRLPDDLDWRHIAGAGILGGIGFTMSIFITNLAFAGNEDLINSSKIAILVASLIAGTFGFLWLRYFAAANRPTTTYNPGDKEQYS